MQTKTMKARGIQRMPRPPATLPRLPILMTSHTKITMRSMRRISTRFWKKSCGIRLILRKIGTTTQPSTKQKSSRPAYSQPLRRRKRRNRRSMRARVRLPQQARSNSKNRLTTSLVCGIGLRRSRFGSKSLREPEGINSTLCTKSSTNL